ncbi:hypothetical protein [Brevibacillus brevis]|uniref:Uncharacterized protein n=1 Tax=Brevibacillus brevis TaxID=1393 RepID=A0A517I2V0_BREBE|nr:hypothetical protein [Brevibacillus brevis]QDS33231.1 hypothetical protein FPS98_04115 [Brevibacillus brevis]
MRLFIQELPYSCVTNQTFICSSVITSAGLVGAGFRHLAFSRSKDLKKIGSLITPHMQKETADAFGEMFFSAPNGTKKSLVE